MPATNRLSRVAQWQNAPLNLSDFAAVRWSLMALSVISLRRKNRSLMGA
jgi:hypothetical protein